MISPIHALDSFFYTSMGAYSFQAQCEMVAEVGYDAITVAAWGGQPLIDLTQLKHVKARHGLDIAALYLVLHEGRNDALVRQIVESVEGVELIELAVQTSRNGLPAILSVIESLLPIVERRGLRLALYPHRNHVTQTTSQVVDLCNYFHHPRLGAVFNGYYWYTSQEGDLLGCLEAMRLGSCKSPPLARRCRRWGGAALPPWNRLIEVSWTISPCSVPSPVWATAAESACSVGITAAMFT
ncbi:hypothetical protein SAMN05216603_101412 [Pseudomonas benzenivorans]|jgi:sugar phosphate isomerase/epimerase|nr:hypothetical protein SAMN05216603_101412 [Pseudomonas benzenivorans]